MVGQVFEQVGAGLGRMAKAYRQASQRSYFLSFPLMMLKNVCWRSEVTAPGQLAPIFRLSTSRIGVTSAAVPVKTASSAV